MPHSSVLQAIDMALLPSRGFEVSWPIDMQMSGRLFKRMLLHQPEVSRLESVLGYAKNQPTNTNNFSGSSREWVGVKVLGQKSRRTRVSRIFRYFVPNFAPNFAPKFARIFRGFFVLRFMRNGDQKKFTYNPRHFSMQNSPANTK